MRIQHNIMAMNSYRNYTANNADLSKNLEKLSSGYKINRAGDDAAGLAISEKMRAQITGLETAQSNAQSGINLVQTAEGALTEVHEMLNRMVELADQSANGTYDSTTDRANLQKEFEALSSEIDRIADASNFNGQKLLDGSMDNATLAKSSTYTAGATTGTGAATAAAFVITVNYTDADGAAQTKDVTVANAVNNVTAADAQTAIVAGLEADGDLNTLFSFAETDGRIVATTDATGANEGAVTGITFKTTNGTLAIAAGTGTVGNDAGSELKLQIGDTSDSYNQITVGISSMKVSSLKLDGVSITSQTSAAAAVDLINDAIDTVSATRGDLGATQNRLEHTINNLSVMTENIQDAEASIRDVDVAEEMMEYTKNNILVQSAQAMLAQANQVPQGVLQLLQ